MPSLFKFNHDIMGYYHYQSQQHCTYLSLASCKFLFVSVSCSLEGNLDDLGLGRYDEIHQMNIFYIMTIDQHYDN